MGNCMVVKQESYDRAQKNMLNLPSFCAVYQDETGPVDEATAKLVADTWAVCMAGTAGPYLEAHRVTPSITPLVFFYNTYYSHLFELAPEIRPLFTRSMVSQGRMLANMIKSVVINISQDYNLFRLSLEAMGRNHNKMGIKAEYYALSGLCLFTTIRVCLGEKIYNEEIRIAWTRLYARMMQIIIPVTVSNAMPGSESKEDYFMKVIKVQNHEGEREAKQSMSRTPPSSQDKKDGSGAIEPISVTVAGLEDQLANLGESLVVDLKRRMQAHVPSLTSDRSYKGVEYKQVMVGSEVVDWLIVNKIVDTRDNAVRMASQLWALGLRHVHEHESLLDDYSFYYWLPELPAAEAMGAQEASELKLSILEAKLIDTRTYKLETYTNCLVASSLVDWLVSTQRAADRMAAVHIGRQLRHIGLHACHGHIPFDDTFSLFSFEPRVSPAPSKTGSGIGLGSHAKQPGTFSGGSSSPSPGTPTGNTTVTIGGITTSTLVTPIPTQSRVLGTGHAFLVGSTGSGSGSGSGSPPQSPFIHTTAGVTVPAGGFVHGGGNRHTATVTPVVIVAAHTGTASGGAPTVPGSPVQLPGVIPVVTTPAGAAATPLIS